MAEHPEVFISATTRDLGSYRREIKDALLSLQIFPIEESSFTLAYGSLTEMLRKLIGRCDAVIHLAGFSYGAEPPQRPPDQPRRSYTQLEYDVTRELGKPLYLFLAAEGCAFDGLPEEGEDERALQLAHRQAIQSCGDLYYWFASTDDLRSRIRELRFPARDAKAPRRVVNLPYNSLGPLFKGRDAALAQLRQRLASGPCQAIHGLGGVGKTRLATEYAWRQASDYENALLFVSARSPADFRINLAALCNAEVLNLPQQNQAEEAARLAAVFRWLGEHSGWLLILDNADTPEAAVEVEKTLPRLQGGAVIITSRIADWSAEVQTTELDVLGEQDAAAFLFERTEPRRKKTVTDAEDASVLAHELGGLALALEQAGAYIAKNRFSFTEYRQRWESTREKVLAWYDERLMKYPSSVAMTWQTTFDQLTQPERALLNILPWLAPEPIPASLQDDVPVDDADARDALSGLVSWSLARWTADGNAFTIHRLVQEITRQRLSDNEKDSALERVLEILDAKLPSPEALIVTRKEIEFMAELVSLIPTPRTAKRLGNIYRLIRAWVSPDALPQFLGREQEGGQYQTVLAFLAIQVGFPLVANELFAQIRRNSPKSWAEIRGILETNDNAAESREGPRANRLSESVQVRRREHLRLAGCLDELLAKKKLTCSLDNCVSWIDRISRYSFRATEQE
jgi:hypothetical protein